MSTTQQFGPPARRAEWQAFFEADRLSLEHFKTLVAAEGPGTSLLTIDSMINNLYLWVERLRRANDPRIPKLLEEVQYKAAWLATRSRELRLSVGALQRELDLNTLRVIRRSACVTVVIGAGATIAAGGPSWPELVSYLLIRALERGHEIDKARARHIITAIEQGTATTEMLMHGAQLCHEARGQHLFADITGLLYQNDRQPSPVHHAIAELAGPIELHDPERSGLYPGLESIISYNFDDLMGEALDARGIARRVHVTNTRLKKIAAYSSKPAREANDGEPVLDIFHVHGYTRRNPMPITDIQFVFSVSQFESIYQGMKSPASSGMIDYVFERSLARPVYHALYVGCSFDDPVMNRLLINAAAKLPGRYHYAILKWKGRSRFEESSADEISSASVRYEPMGIRPIWCDRHEEIPKLLGRLV